VGFILQLLIAGTDFRSSSSRGFPADFLNQFLLVISLGRLVPPAAPDVPASPSSCRANSAWSESLVFRRSTWCGARRSCRPHQLVNFYAMPVTKLFRDLSNLPHSMQGIRLPILFTASPSYRSGISLSAENYNWQNYIYAILAANFKDTSQTLFIEPSFIARIALRCDG
jgi:hypothetical protein